MSKYTPALLDLLAEAFPKQPNFRLRWLHEKNEDFDGKAPIQLIDSGNIDIVISYLELKRLNHDDRG